MNIDHYAGAAPRWANGASLVYGPIAAQLIDTSPRPLHGRVVLDVGAGTGVATTALLDEGAHPIAADLSYDMLAWQAGSRPPAAVTDVCRLAFRDHSLDGVVAAFVLNHLVEPAAGLAELIRVTRSGGPVLACVYANASRSEVRDAIDQAAQGDGWEIPTWYLQLKEQATPVLGTAEDMKRVAVDTGLTGVTVAERPVDVGVTTAEQLVSYRLGQAHYSAWLDRLGADRASEVTQRLVEMIRPIMRPYQPIVVFLSGVAP